jgi:hypothetical protein
MGEYESWRLRLTALRGRAADHLCAECSKPAHEWAYSGGDPAEVQVIRPITDPFAEKSAYTVPLSFDPERYVPLCRSCHRRRKSAPRRYPRHTLVDLRKPDEWTGIRRRCWTCGMTKDAGAFSKSTLAKRDGRRQLRCRLCNAQYQARQKAVRLTAKGQ